MVEMRRRVVREGCTLNVGHCRDNQNAHMKASSRLCILAHRVFALLLVIAALSRLCFIIVPQTLTMMSVVGPRSRWGLFVVVAWISTQVMYNLVHVLFTCPGSCSQSRPYNTLTGQYAVSIQVDEVEVPMLYAAGYCGSCAIWKPPRSQHCYYCGICVMRIDHHSWVLGSCVGFRNHGNYLLMLLFSAIGLFLLALFGMLDIIVPAFASLLSLWRHAKRELLGHFHDDLHGTIEGFIKTLAAFPHSSTETSNILAAIPFQGLSKLSVEAEFGHVGFYKVVEVTLTLVAFLSVCIELCCAMYRAYNGTTKFELDYPMKDYVEIISPGVYCPVGPGFYRRASGIHNLIDVFGPAPWLRILFPNRGTALDLTLGVSPVVGEEGTVALKRRIQEVKSKQVLPLAADLEALGITKPIGTV